MKHAYRIAGLGILLGTAVTLASVPAMARGPMGGGAEGLGLLSGDGTRGGLFVTAFADLDRDGNGQITEEDLQSGAEARLAEIDADANGLVSVEELTAVIETRIAERMQGRSMRPRGMDATTMAKTMAERMLAARDADKDGALSLAELGPDKGFGRVIDRFDTDDDNAISEAEYDEAKAAMTERFARNDRRGDGWDDRGGKGGRGRGHGGGRR